MNEDWTRKAPAPHRGDPPDVTRLHPVYEALVRQMRSRALELADEFESQYDKMTEPMADHSLWIHKTAAALSLDTTRSYHYWALELTLIADHPHRDLITTAAVARCMHPSCIKDLLELDVITPARLAVTSEVPTRQRQYEQLTVATSQLWLLILDSAAVAANWVASALRRVKSTVRRR